MFYWCNHNYQLILFLKRLEVILPLIESPYSLVCDERKHCVPNYLYRHGLHNVCIYYMPPQSTNNMVGHTKALIYKRENLVFVQNQKDPRIENDD